MPGAKNFTVEDKRVAIGLWKGGLPLSKIREQLQMSKASLKSILGNKDGEQRLSAVPGGVDAQEAAGGHQQGRQHHQVLGRGPVHNNQPFSGLKFYQ